jgi:hypothetical protein
MGIDDLCGYQIRSCGNLSGHLFGLAPNYFFRKPDSVDRPEGEMLPEIPRPDFTFEDMQ